MFLEDITGSEDERDLILLKQLDKFVHEVVR